MRRKSVRFAIVEQGEAGVDESALTATRIIAFGLLGAAALHPHTLHAVETVLAPFDRLVEHSPALIIASYALQGATSRILHDASPQ